MFFLSGNSFKRQSSSQKEMKSTSNEDRVWKICEKCRDSIRSAKNETESNCRHNQTKERLK